MGWAEFLLDADSRANRLDRYRVSCRSDQSEFYVQLCCVQEIASQVEKALGHLHCRPAPGGGVQWTHRFRFDGPYHRSLRDFLDLLKRVLTLTPVSELDCALVLDFYKVPDPDLAPTDWANTEVGERVNRAKYWATDPVEQRRAGRWLADALAEVVEQHSGYQSADAIVAVPGTQTEFGDKLARAVAHRVGKPLVRAVASSKDRRPAKEGHATGGLEQFIVPSLDAGTEVIIVDDVYRSGKTMRGVAVAARAAGAGSVLGLVAARTMRKC